MGWCAHKICIHHDDVYQSREGRRLATSSWSLHPGVALLLRDWPWSLQMIWPLLYQIDGSSPCQGPGLVHEKGSCDETYSRDLDLVTENKKQLIDIICIELIRDVLFHRNHIQNHKLIIISQDITPFEISIRGVTINRRDMDTAHKEADIIIVQQMLMAAKEKVVRSGLHLSLLGQIDASLPVHAMNKGTMSNAWLKGYTSMPRLCSLTPTSKAFEENVNSVHHQTSTWCRSTRIGHWEKWMAWRWGQQITCTYDNSRYSQSYARFCIATHQMWMRVDEVAGVPIYLTRCSVLVMMQFAATQMLCDLSQGISVEQSNSKLPQIDLTCNSIHTCLELLNHQVVSHLIWREIDSYSHRCNKYNNTSIINYFLFTMHISYMITYIVY